MKNVVLKRKHKRLIFYVCMMILPITQFCIFYLGVNANSLLLAFKNYSFDKGDYIWVGVSNFSNAFSDLFSIPYLKYALKNSIIVYAATLFAGITLSLLFSYYITKKMRFNGAFKLFLFMPQIISSVVIVVMFKYFTDRAIPAFLELITGKPAEGLLSTEKTRFATLLFFMIWVGFGAQVLMYTGAMSNISDSVIDAGKIDGVTVVKEFFYITLPTIYPTIVTFITVGVASIFTNQMHLFSFYDSRAEYQLYTIGYFLYKSIQQSKTIADYPYLAAFGLMFTAVAIPLTLGIRKLLEKIGPKVD